MDEEERTKILESVAVVEDEISGVCPIIPHILCIGFQLLYSYNKNFPWGLCKINIQESRRVHSLICIINKKIILICTGTSVSCSSERCCAAF
jgi:hypothetical protein